MGKHQGLRLNASRAQIGNQGPLVVAMMPSTRSLASEANCGGSDCLDTSSEFVLI